MDVNSTAPIFLYLGEKIGFVANIIRILVGGVFGIYVIMLILRWKEYRQMVKLMTEIRDDIRVLKNREPKK
ncbi:MAG: hypothetical protein ABH879_00690 [archaeon]